MAIGRLVLGLSVALAIAKPAMATPLLEKVIILQRHGVRSPTKAPADLAPYARDVWAQWPVAPGELTDHGAASLSLMGDALRRHYGALGLLPSKGCAAKGTIFVWADSSDQRTRRSGQVMATALAPGCRLDAQMLPDGKDDALFHSAAEICPADPVKMQAALSQHLARLMPTHGDDYEAARTKLQSILDPDQKKGECAAEKKCTIAADRNDAHDGKLSGTVADASTMAENLFLEYAQGMPRPGWGRLRNADDLAGFMPLHHYYADLTRRDPVPAAQNGTLLARQIRDALDPVAAFAHEAPVPKNAKLILLAGDDTNISNLAGMLGLHWDLPDEPDGTAPDTALAFEIWRQLGGAHTVRIALFYQTPDQLRNLTHFDATHPLPHIALTLAGCAEGLCPIATVTAALDAALVPECIQATH